MALKNNTKIDQIKSYLKKSNDYRYKDQMINFLKQNKNLPFNEDVLYDVLKIIIDNNLDFYTSINDAQKLYDTIVCDENNLEQYKMFLRIFPMHQQCDNNTAFKDANNFEIIYNMFENKKLLESIYKEIKDMNNTYYVYDYIIEARQYFVDEIAFYSSIMKFIISIKNNNIYLASEKEKFKEKQIENAKKMAGLYEINERKLEELPQKLENITTRQNELEIKLQKSHNLVDNFLSTLNKNMENYQIEKKEDLEQIKNYVMELESYANEIKQNKTNNKTTSNSKIDTLIEQLMIYNNCSIKKQDNLTNNNEILNQNNGLPKKEYNDENNNFKYYAIRVMLEKIKNEIPVLMKEECDFDKIMYQKIEKFIRLDYDKKTYDISNNDYRYCIYYYYALYNDTEDILGDLINLLRGIEDIKLIYLKDTIVSEFDKKTYLSLFPNRKKLIDVYSDDIKLLKKLLDINKDFNMDLDLFSVKEVIDVFGIEIVANYTPIFKKNIVNICNEDSELLKIYKEIYNLNPEFTLESTKFLKKYNTLKNNNIFSIEELINLTEDQQNKISNLFNSKIVRNPVILFLDDTALIGKYREFIRNVVLDTSVKCFLDKLSLFLFEDNFTTPEKYILYDYEKSFNIVNYYDRLKNEDGFVDKALAKKQIKSKIKIANKIIKNK